MEHNGFEFVDLGLPSGLKWATNYEGTGVNGRKFTSKSDSSKYIFIPTSGYLGFDCFLNEGHNADLWSSTVSIGYPYGSWSLCLGYGGFEVYDIGRWYGFCVRGVF